jgi:hypothetical protein
MSHCTYLIQLPSSYYFRIRVPPTLQSIVGRKEIRYSLRCGSLAKAKLKARLLAGKIQQLFTYRDIMSLSQKQIQGIISDYVQDTLTRDNTDRILMEPLPHNVMGEDNMSIDCVIAELKVELGRSNHVATVGKRVQDIWKEICYSQLTVKRLILAPVGKA